MKNKITTTKTIYYTSEKITFSHGFIYFVDDKFDESMLIELEDLVSIKISTYA